MTKTSKQYRQAGRSERSIDRVVLRALLCCACSVPAMTVHAETRAGERIVNTATASYAFGTNAEATRSNSDVVIVAERLDVALSALDRTAASAVPVLLVNRGNGIEAFRLSAGVDTGNAPTRFAIDADGDGRYDAARDPLLVDATTPLLDAGASLRLLVLLDAPTTGPVTIVAQAVTGAGTPGTVFAGMGDGGGDAVVGPTGARAELVVPVAEQDAAPTLTKTQSVFAPDGSARAIRGAVISYTLVARFPTAVSAARIDDPVPAGTIYVPGSLSLDGAALADSGTSGEISVALGDVPTAGIRTLQFKVRIQ